MNKQPILFLDIDGVINPYLTEKSAALLEKSDGLQNILYKKYKKEEFLSIPDEALFAALYLFDRTSIVLIKKLCETYHFKLVITSSWASFLEPSELNALFFLVGLDHYIEDQIVSSRPRADSIETYLSQNPTNLYFILDDLNMTDRFKEHMILTNDHFKEEDYQKIESRIQ